MLWPGIEKLGRELQLKRTDSEVVGAVRNSFVKLYDGRNMKVLELLVPDINDADKEYVINQLSANKVKKYEWLEYGVRIIFNEYFRPYSIKKIRDIMMDFTEYFCKNYPNQKPRCQKCGHPKDLEPCRADNATIFVCEGCYKTLENEISEANLENRYVAPNYLAGFLGSLLYSVPGIIITVVFFVFLDTLAAISSVLYVFLGIKGYKKFNGKISRAGAGIIILSTLIMVGLGVFVSYSILILKELGEFDLELLIAVLKLPDVQKELLHNVFMSYAVSGIFLVFQLIQMMKVWKSEKVVQKAKDII